LRRMGESILTIARKVGVSKGTVSLWCGDIILTKGQRERLIQNDRRGGAVGRAMAAISIRNERMGRLAEYMDKGKRLVNHMSKRDIFIAGIALYWAEGNKKNRRLIFTNSDPKMIQIWMRWLKECLNISVNDISCNVGINQLHEYRVGKVEKYWSNISGVPLENFRKVSLKMVKPSKVYENPEEHFGTMNVRVKRSTNLNYLMLGLIEGLTRT